VQAARGDHDEAVSSLLTEAGIRRQLDGDNALSLRRTLGLLGVALGAVATAMGSASARIPSHADPLVVLQTRERALDLLTNARGQSEPSVAVAHIAVAKAFLAVGATSDALAHFEEALKSNAVGGVATTATAGITNAHARTHTHTHTHTHVLSLVAAHDDLCCYVVLL
jgi:hypothetical protein